MASEGGDLPQKAKSPPEEQRRWRLRRGKWRSLLAGLWWRRRSKCVMCLQDRPLRGDFLHYRSTGRRSTLRSFTVWVSLVDAGDGDLGTFEVDLGGVVFSGDGDALLGGKTVILGLSGMAEGGVLSISIFYRVVEAGAHGGGCLPCLSDSSNCRAAATASSILIAAGDIDPTEEEDESSTTTEKEAVARARSRRPPRAPPSTSAEFLRMLEGHGGGFVDEESLNLSLSFDGEKDSDSLLNAAARVGRRPAGSALEEEEFKQLLKMWKVDDLHCPTTCSLAFSV
ncbi:unnamed protein product [Spirodela intermedia]|uniref:Uncharacterized protein n=1 Tax=Spirodela intermedia TaxID=51605 RepID=A0A7I8IX46_SPIIN|nr:unnamed protein product [Spirodela intermedia]CAA6662575.1 unnamed protein product [Spirodela intermedia]